LTEHSKLKNFKIVDNVLHIIQGTGNEGRLARLMFIMVMVMVVMVVTMMMVKMMMMMR